MFVNLKPNVGAILEAQVAAGLYVSVEEALTAAVLGVPPANVGDLSWAKPYLDAADEDIKNGRTISEEETFAELERMFESD